VFENGEKKQEPAVKAKGGRRKEDHYLAC